MDLLFSTNALLNISFLDMAHAYLNYTHIAICNVTTISRITVAAMSYRYGPYIADARGAMVDNYCDELRHVSHMYEGVPSL
jgi:hypothetical protein